ncbi:hypothetical protein PVA44_06615 (plasmid) [Entomospira nematocerorum]|uniref:Uncharacterized protein n=1 Tax=Entomospira nematocerorum TaxID=2719987 RepID=A0A968GEH2_9SPIO|nr:hypothetical protein [Entomospira nematocera]NIZ47577.1 hypothetical protein [Entomospira nematocera]WDI34581.1 hypothetical protein PVA44_06615 [Entomospira nematocera]
MKKIIVTTALSLLLLTGMAFAQTSDIDARQDRLDQLQSELEDAQRIATANARMDQLNREAVDQQQREHTEQEHINNIDRLQHQIKAEEERAARQEAELKRIEELRQKIAKESEDLRQARLEEYNRQIAAERQRIEQMKKDRIAALQAQISEEQKELDALHAEMNSKQHNEAPAEEEAPTPAPAPAPEKPMTAAEKKAAAKKK